MRAALLVNPAAGSVPADKGGIDRLVAALGHAGYAMTVQPRPDLPLDVQLGTALAARPAVIFVIGGDGTIRAVAERLAGHDITLGVLPGGTMNRLAARLGLPGDLLAAARSLAGASSEPLAIGGLNGRVFLYQSIVGRPSRLVRFREMQRGVGLPGWLPLIRAALRAVARPPRRSLRLRGQDRAMRADAVVVTLPLPGAAAQFQVDAVRRGGVLTGLRQAWRWIRGRLAEDSDVASFARPHLAVQGRDRMLRVTLDGEQLLLAPPLRYRLRPDALRVLRPRSA
ncbi:diacylglycerol kinase family protein [Roseomonas sp. CAU 1739]|uniref:diacylglycerol/lipid kinase family protein n=1 Tax=Roseomonas sp. CAU 1739 TaxID=3140364 RepID=UPI00325AE19A